MLKEVRELRVGIVPTKRERFSHPLAVEQKNAILAKMREFEKSMSFTGVYIEDLNELGLLQVYAEAAVVEDKMRAAKVDALFLPHTNFGQEEAVARLAKNLGVPVLMWGPRDPAPEGTGRRPTDSQCGLFASTKVLQRYGVKFSYIENCALDDDVFEKEFAQFLAVASVIKAFRHMRVAVVSTRPKEFLSVMVNEAELLEKFGVELVPAEGTVITEMAKKHLAENHSGQAAILQDLEARGIDLSQLGEKKYAFAAVELALREFAEINQCTALAGECWRLIRQSFNISPCAIFGDLNDHGLPTACETDIHAAIMSAMAVAAARYKTPSYVADLTIRHPENDNAELMWHCGPFAKTLKKGEGGYIVESGQAYYEIVHGTHSILRFDGLGGDYYMFAGKGKGVPGPVTNGNYVWIEAENWVHWEKKFMFGPYIHHVVGIPMDVIAVMREASRYLGIIFDDAESDRFVYNLR